MADRLFTTWLTSQARRDHAVTDEEFTAHAPGLTAVCGTPIQLAPMEWAPGPRCLGCVAVLAGMAQVDTAPGRPQRDNTTSLWVRIFRPFRWIAVTPDWATSHPGSQEQTSSPARPPKPGDLPQPPAAMYWPVVATGAPAGTETQTPFPFRPTPDAVTTPGTTLPAAGLSPADPEGRDSHQDVQRPRRRVLMTETPVELAPLSPPVGRELDRAIAQTAPTLR